MANQPESPSFDAGIYQLETTDPVQGGSGGLSNTPILGLANRTAWLKVQVDALVASVALKAPIASPTLTGDPKAPTPPAGDSDTSIATTAFVQGAINGVLTKAVPGSGSVTLTAAEGGGFFYNFTGALTGARTVVFPQKARQMVVLNSTTGAFPLTVKMATGAGVVVQQGRLLHVVLDGVDARRGTTDFTDASLAGDPQAPTPPFGDNDNSIATTAFVQAAVSASAAWSTGDVKATLKTAADPGWVLMNDGTIGNAASGASTRANADCLALYTLIWNTIADAWAPVVGGRSATALDDWNANRRLTLPRALGRAMAAAGSGSGLTARVLGSYTGTETHQLTTAQMPLHRHTVTIVPGGKHQHTAVTSEDGEHVHQFRFRIADLFAPGVTYLWPQNMLVETGEATTQGKDTQPAGKHQHSLTTSEAVEHGHDASMTDAGSDQAHPNVQPTFFVNFMVKL